MTARRVGPKLVLLVGVLATCPVPAQASQQDLEAEGSFKSPRAATLLDGFGAINPTWLAKGLHPLAELGMASARPATSHAVSGPSGLHWRSGVGCWDTAFERYRKRPTDVYVHFVGRETRRGVIRAVRNSYTGAFAKRPGRLALSFPMLTADIAGQFAQCARGSFDNYVKDVVNALKKHKINDPIIRLGWEPNGTFPWSLGRWPGRAQDYVRCFRRQTKIIRSRLPEARIDWTNRRGSALPYSVERIYPGDRYVDIIGLMIYDRWPVHHDREDWRKAHWMRDRSGGPKGLGTYLQMAHAHGKKLSVSEWAVSNNRNDPSSFDNPFFIEKMHEFFRTQAKNLAYEAYFNCGSTEPSGSNGGYRLSPSTVNPRTSAAYLKGWGRP